MGGLGQRYLDVLRKHLELGTSLRHVRMNEDQKERTRICLELYNLRKQNPYLDIDTYLKNKYNRTYWEIRHDKDCLDFICSVLDAGGKNIVKAQVRKTYEMAAKMAYDQGDAKNMISAAKHLSDLEKLTEPEQGEDLENSMAKLPPVFTPDARKVLPGKTFSNSKQLDRIRSKWGVQKDEHQDAIDRRAEELSSGGESDATASSPMGFDLSSLSKEQLVALQQALNARVATQEPSVEEIDDEDEND